MLTSNVPSSPIGRQGFSNPSFCMGMLRFFRPEIGVSIVIRQAAVEAARPGMFTRIGRPRVRTR